MMNDAEDISECNLPGPPVVRSLNEEEDTTERSSVSTPDETSCDSSEKSISIQKYEEEWTQLYRRDDPELGELRRRAILGNLRASRFRSVCWRSLLAVFSPDTSQWLNQLQQQRRHYAQILKELSLDPWDRSQPEDNPLSQQPESMWHQYFCDKELQSLIRQDVVRTFPGVDFFRKDTIQNSMVNILFCYARENPAMCYRQGMHEILAPLMFVLHCDHQVLLHTREHVTVSDVIAEVLDPAFLEEDAYTLFCRIMSGIESYYRISDLTPTPTGYFPANIQSPQGNGSGNLSENEVVTQLNWIRDTILFHADQELYKHLEQLDIPLPLFGIRWLRLLFGREFPLQDLLVLWDVIFAEGENFELVNYVVVAMLMAIRCQLLSGDYTTCMTYFMRYPGAVDITYIIEHALYLRDEQKCGSLAMTSSPNLPVVTVDGKASLNRAAGQQTGVADKELPKVPTKSQQAFLSGRLKKFSKRPDYWLGKHTQTGGATGSRGDADASIVDGFTLDDPAVLRKELQEAHAIMSLCRMKLSQYHNLLQRSFPPTASAEVLQVLEGLQELCSLLRSHRHLSQQLEVETAYEAGETRTDKQSVTLQRALSPPTKLALQRQNQEKKKMVVEKRKDGGVPPPKSDVRMKVFSTVEGLSECVQGVPSKDPLGIGHSLEREPSIHLGGNCDSVRTNLIKLLASSPRLLFDEAGLYDYCNEHSVSIKIGEFLD